MSRRHSADKREILPDPKFGDLVLGKFMNVLMVQGKKSVAESIIYGSLDKVQKVTKAANESPLEPFHKALNNVRPYLEVRSRRVGGATYQVPVDVKPDRGIALAMRWIIKAARARNEKTMIDRLAGELMDALNNRGGAIKKREDTHRMAEANKAFAHFRW